MILFVGEQDKGYFIPEIAQKHDEKCEYSGFVSSLEDLYEEAKDAFRK